MHLAGDNLRDLTMREEEMNRPLKTQYSGIVLSASGCAALWPVAEPGSSGP